MAPTLSAHSTNGMGPASVNIKQFEPPLDSVEAAYFASTQKLSRKWHVVERSEGRR